MRPVWFFVLVTTLGFSEEVLPQAEEPIVLILEETPKEAEFVVEEAPVPVVMEEGVGPDEATPLKKKRAKRTKRAKKIAVQTEENSSQDDPLSLK